MGEIGTDENFGDKTGGDRPREHCICIQENDCEKFDKTFFNTLIVKILYAK